MVARPSNERVPARLWFSVHSTSSRCSQRPSCLAQCYDAVAATAPTLNLIPLLPSAGWDAAAVARIEPVVTTVFAPPSYKRSAVEAAAIDAVVARPYLTPKNSFQQALVWLILYL